MQELIFNPKNLIYSEPVMSRTGTPSCLHTINELEEKLEAGQ